MFAALRLQGRFRFFHSRAMICKNFISFQESREVAFMRTIGFYTNHLNNHMSSIVSGITGIWPFHWSISHHNIQLFSTRISNENEAMDSTLDHILSAIRNDESSTGEVADAYLSAYCKSGDYMSAIRVWQFLRSEGIILNPNSYEVLLVMSGEANNIDIMFQIFRDLSVSSKSLRLSSYTSLSMAFIKIDDSALILKFVEDILLLSASDGNKISINRLIYTLSESGQTGKALLLFNNMKNLKCKPGLITYNIVLAILGNSGQFDEMLSHFSAMKDVGILPDRVTYTTLLNFLKKVGRLAVCLEISKEMIGMGIELDLRTYTALIDLFGRVGNIEESLKLFYDMKEKQIRPSIYIYRSLISNLMKIGKLGLAESFSREMKSCLPDLVGPKDFKKKRR